MRFAEGEGEEHPPWLTEEQLATASSAAASWPISWRWR